MKSLVPLLAVPVLLTACARPADTPSAASAAASESAPDISNLPAGDYKADPAHTSLVFEVNHLGFSHYTARFTKIEAQMSLDPAHPEAAKLTAVIDPQSLDLNAPPKGFHEELMGKAWFGAAQYPAIRFVSTAVKRTSPATADVTGNLSLHGVTRPVILHVRFNGGYPGLQVYDPNARLGFSATGALKRSDFGVSFGIPQAGSTMGVGDQVDFQIETEFTGPALKTS